MRMREIYKLLVFFFFLVGGLRFGPHLAILKGKFLALCLRTTSWRTICDCIDQTRVGSMQGLTLLRFEITEIWSFFLTQSYSSLLWLKKPYAYSVPSKMAFQLEIKHSSPSSRDLFNWSKTPVTSNIEVRWIDGLGHSFQARVQAVETVLCLLLPTSMNHKKNHHSL